MGYIGQKMSIRAAEAYEGGYMPKSKWSKSEMLYAIEEYCSDNDYGFDEDHFKGYKKEELFYKFFEFKEWHHTGKYFNRTDFYGINEYALDNELENLDIKDEEWQL